eukprot:gene23856-28936_t
MEGSASCYVNAALQATPGDHSGFFNPKMKLNRDLTVWLRSPYRFKFLRILLERMPSIVLYTSISLLLDDLASYTGLETTQICTLGAAVSQRALRFSDERLPPPQCLDAFAASGILGIRWALEAARGAELVIAINDADHYCSELMMQNCALNGLPVGKPGTQDSLKADAPQVEMHVSCRDATPELSANAVDVTGDLTANVTAKAPHKGVISLTATDTSALFGIYPDVTYSCDELDVAMQVVDLVDAGFPRNDMTDASSLGMTRQIMPLHSCPACGERGFAATGSVPCSCATSGAPSAPETAGPMWCVAPACATSEAPAIALLSLQ